MRGEGFVVWGRGGGGVLSWALNQFSHQLGDTCNPLPFSGRDERVLANAFAVLHPLDPLLVHRGPHVVGVQVPDVAVLRRGLDVRDVLQVLRVRRLNLVDDRFAERGVIPLTLGVTRFGKWLASLEEH